MVYYFCYFLWRRDGRLLSRVTVPFWSAPGNMDNGHIFVLWCLSAIVYALYGCAWVSWQTVKSGHTVNFALFRTSWWTGPSANLVPNIPSSDRSWCIHPRFRCALSHSIAFSVPTYYSMQLYYFAVVSRTHTLDWSHLRQPIIGLKLCHSFYVDLLYTLYDHPLCSPNVYSCPIGDVKKGSLEFLSVIFYSCCPSSLSLNIP